MEPYHLRTFLSVAKHRNYTHAARELYLSQPAVSRQIRQLEGQLGVRVFEQLGKVVDLTDAGRTLEREAKLLLGQLERATEAVQAHRGTDRGTLRLGASTTPGLYLLPELIGRFHRRFPDVQISYAVDNSLCVEEAILKNEMDLGFVGAHLSHGDLNLEPIVEDEVIFFTSPGHVLARKRGSIQRLEREIWVIREQGSATRQLVEKRLAERGVRIGRSMVLTCPEGVKALVASGVGFSFLSRYALRDDLERGRLQQVHVPGLSVKRPIFGVRHAGKHISPVLQAFLDLVRESVP